MLPYLLLAPTILLIAVLTIYPTIFLVYASFFLPGPGAARFLGLTNYLALLTDQRLHADVITTVELVTLLLAMEFPLGLFVALAVNRDFIGKRYIVPLIYLPMMISPVVVGLSSKFLFDPSYGPVNYFLGLIGIAPQKWFASVTQALPTVALVDLWEWFPFVFLILYSALQSMPTDYVEAASIDGAGWWDQLRYVILPLLKHPVIVVMAFRLIDAMRIFDIIYTVTNGGPGTATETFSFYIFQVAFRWFDLGYAASIALITIFVTMTLAQVVLKKVRW